MKKTILTLTCILLAVLTFAAEFQVISYKLAPNDLAARKYERTDINGQSCAIIKVQSDIKNLNFDANSGVVGDVEVKQGEYWVYVSPGEKQLRVMHDDYMPLNFNIPGKVESGNVYILKLKSIGSAEVMDEDLVKITFRLNEADVYIAKDNGAPIKTDGKIAVYQLPEGSYTFKFTKDGFDDKVQNLDVESEKIVDIEIIKGASATSLKLDGILTITSEPAGADIYLNDQKVGATPFMSQLIAGEYQLMVKKNFYQTYSGTFNLNEGETKELPQIDLVPKFGYLEITSTPSESRIFLDGKSLGTTPIVRTQVSSGEHTITAQKDLYHSKDQNIVINDGDDEALNITLLPAFGTLIINSEPQGADVFIDGEKVGQTPFENPQMPSGTYDVEVKKEMWSDITETVIVSDNKTTEKIMPLNKNFGTVSIVADGADIYIDDKKVGNGGYNANLKPGKYIIKASKHKHRDAEKEVYVTIGSNESITLKPEPIQGSVSIFSEPFDTKGANIYINGSKRKEYTPAVIPLLIGDYNIKVQKDGFLESEKRINLKEGENQQLTFELQTFKGSQLQEFRKYKTWQWVSIGGAAAFAGAGTYFYLSANSMYNEYKTATDNATDLHNQVESYDRIYPILYGAAVACLVPTIIFTVKKNKAKKNVDLSLVPLEGGGMVCLRMGF